MAVFTIDSASAWLDMKRCQMQFALQSALRIRDTASSLASLRLQIGSERVAWLDDRSNRADSRKAKILSIGQTNIHTPADIMPRWTDTKRAIHLKVGNTSCLALVALSDFMDMNNITRIIRFSSYSLMDLNAHKIYFNIK